MKKPDTEKSRETVPLTVVYFEGLLVALQNATPRSLIVVFTDNGSKDLDLEKEIIRPVMYHYLPVK